MKMLAWMAKPGICVRMEIGSPQVSVEGLTELHRLLQEMGYRRSCASDTPSAKEQFDVKVWKPSEKGTVIDATAANQHGVGGESYLGIEWRLV